MNTANVIQQVLKENGAVIQHFGGVVSISNIRTWAGGPLRQMATTKLSAVFVPFAKSMNGCHFAGRYVCDECQEPCAGVSLQNDGKLSGNRPSKWLCDLCLKGKERKTATPEQKQAAIHRLAAARRDRATSVRIQGKEDVAISNVVVAVTADVNPAEEVYGAM
jgi:hypothetical protein